MNTLTWTLCALLGLQAARSGELSSWVCAPAATPVKLAGYLDAVDLSGIAKTGCHVMVGSDELAAVQMGTLEPGSGIIRFSSLIPLVARSGKKRTDNAEIDIEGVCHDPSARAFYATGSHGAGKRKGDFQPLRCGVYRLPFDPETGRILTGQISKSSLLPWLESSTEFKASMRQPLQQNGFNIEGLAAAAGNLYFGVRSPNTNGRAFIIEVTADEMFADEGRGIQPRVHPVLLGPDTGIRELARVSGGFLLLSGNAGAEATKHFPTTTSRRPDASFMLGFLPSSGPGQIGEFQRIADVTATDGKAEGLLVLEETADRIDVLVLHDGLDQGGATAYSLRRPKSEAAPQLGR